MINLVGLIAVVAQKCAMKVGLAMIRTDANTKNKTTTKTKTKIKTKTKTKTKTEIKTKTKKKTKTEIKAKDKDRDQDNYGVSCSGCPKVCHEGCESTACHFVSRYFE